MHLGKNEKAELQTELRYLTEYDLCPFRNFIFLLTWKDKIELTGQLTCQRGRQLTKCTFKIDYQRVRVRFAIKNCGIAPMIF